AHGDRGLRGWHESPRAEETRQGGRHASARTPWAVSATRLASPSEVTWLSVSGITAGLALSPPGAGTPSRLVRTLGHDHVGGNGPMVGACWSGGRLGHLGQLGASTVANRPYPPLTRQFLRVPGTDGHGSRCTGA